MDKRPEVKREYEAPAVVELGSLHELTLITCTNKNLGSSDGLTFLNQPIRFSC